MGTVVEHTSGPGNRWVLPLLLVVIIAAVILGAILIPRLTKSSASPTATAKVVVVTSSPTVGVGTVVVTATGTSGSSGTSGGSGTGSTPLPGASPVPTKAGLVLGMITHPASEVAAAQAGVNHNDPAYMFRTDPRQVVQQTLPKEGFKSFTIVSPAPSPSPTPHMGVDNRPVIRFIVSYQGQEYTVAVAQPAKQGPTGVWFIVTVLQGRHL